MMSSKKVKGGWKFDDDIFVSEIQYQELLYLVHKYDLSGTIHTEKAADIKREILLALHDYNEDLRTASLILEEQVERMEEKYAEIDARFSDHEAAERYRLSILRPIRAALKVYKYKHGDAKFLEYLTGGLCRD